MKKHSLIVILLLSVFCLSCDKKSHTEKPNIIIINIDDLGWKDVSYMGSDYYKTPHIDSLSKSGIVFTNGYAASANCAPSRACLMTGKWTPRHGIYTVGSSKRGKSKYRELIPTKNTTTLSKEQTVLPEVLSQNGYITCHAGKWHLSNDPLEYGFDINIAGGHNGHPTSYYPPYGNVHLENSGEENLTDLIMQNVLNFIDSVNQPFFLNYAPYAVHTPIQPIDSLLPKYGNKLSKNGQNNARYATMIENLDRNIGLLISELKNRKLLGNTLIIFTSDNGGLYGITKQYPLRAGKGSYYEGGIRVPFFFVWEGRIAINSKSNFPISNLDIFPTILESVGIDKHTYGSDGMNLLSVLQGEVIETDRPLYWHFPIYLQAYKVSDNENRDSLFRTRPGSVIRYGKWKLHYYFEDDEVELYDLDKDISERNDLSQENIEKTEELMTYLRKWWEETNAPIPKELNPDYEY